VRNPDRIDYVMRELARLWKLHPDWRLGQLVFNIPGRDPFFIEDYDLIDLGYDKYGEGMKPCKADFPEYYVEPNAWYCLLRSDIRETPTDEECSHE